MIFALLFGQHAIAGVGAFESAQLTNTAHAPRQGDIFIRPLGDSSFGLTDRLAVSSSAVDWLSGTPNVSSEFNIVDNWEWALSVTPYISTDYSLQQLRSGATVTHSLQYAEDRLNTSVRVGYVGQREDIEVNDIEGLATGTLEGEIGLSYDIVASRAVIHRFKGSIASGLNIEDTVSASAGYSLHASVGERARLEVGVDVGETSSVSGALFNEHLRDDVYGAELSGESWLPTPHASLFWVF